MKLKLQIAEDTRFDVPIRRINRTRGQSTPVNRASLRALAMAEQPKTGKRHADQGNFCKPLA